jgi:pyridoxamine 5'-phosphate oxidase
MIPFDLPDASPEPADLFSRWFATALHADPQNAAVAALATAAPDARPSLRMVLIKEQGPAGFVFYTHYESRKAAELSANPCAALTFWWPDMERQVRIEGPVEKISAAASDAYFSSRPRSHQLNAWASPQSREIDGPLSLEKVRQRFGDGPVPRPPSWGGFCLRPERFEFWQGHSDRLHDRLLYLRSADGWSLCRIAP